MINAPDKTAPAASRFSDPLLLLFRVLRFLRKKKKSSRNTLLYSQRKNYRETRGYEIYVTSRYTEFKHVARSPGYSKYLGFAHGRGGNFFRRRIGRREMVKKCPPGGGPPYPPPLFLRGGRNRNWFRS